MINWSTLHNTVCTFCFEYSSNPSFLTRTAFLNIIYKITAAFQHPLLPNTAALKSGHVWLRFKDDLDTVLCGDLVENIHVPGAVHFYESVAKYLAEVVSTAEEESKNTESVLLRILSSELYEVRQQALNILTKLDGQPLVDVVDDFCIQQEDEAGDFDSIISSAGGVSHRAEEIMRGSHELFKELVTMVMGKETYPDCLVKVRKIVTVSFCSIL